MHGSHQTSPALAHHFVRDIRAIFEGHAYCSPFCEETRARHEMNPALARTLARTWPTLNIPNPPTSLFLSPPQHNMLKSHALPIWVSLFEGTPFFCGTKNGELKGTPPPPPTPTFKKSEPYCGWTKSCTTSKPWETIVCWYLQGNQIILGSLGWCEMDFAHPPSYPILEDGLPSHPVTRLSYSGPGGSATGQHDILFQDRSFERPLSEGHGFVHFHMTNETPKTKLNRSHFDATSHGCLSRLLLQDTGEKNT